MDLIILGFTILSILLSLWHVFHMPPVPTDEHKSHQLQIHMANTERDLRSEINGLKAEVRFNHNRIADLEKDVVAWRTAKDNSDNTFLTFLTSFKSKEA